MFVPSVLNNETRLVFTNLPEISLTLPYRLYVYTCAAQTWEAKCSIMASTSKAIEPIIQPACLKTANRCKLQMYMWSICGWENFLTLESQTTLPAHLSGAYRPVRSMDLFTYLFQTVPNKTWQDGSGSRSDGVRARRDKRWQNKQSLLILFCVHPVLI